MRLKPREPTESRKAGVETCSTWSTEATCKEVWSQDRCADIQMKQPQILTIVAERTGS